MFSVPDLNTTRECRNNVNLFKNPRFDPVVLRTGTNRSVEWSIDLCTQIFSNIVRSINDLDLISFKRISWTKRYKHNVGSLRIMKCRHSTLVHNTCVELAVSVFT